MFHLLIYITAGNWVAQFLEHFEYSCLQKNISTLKANI